MINKNIHTFFILNHSYIRHVKSTKNKNIIFHSKQLIQKYSYTVHVLTVGFVFEIVLKELLFSNKISTLC